MSFLPALLLLLQAVITVHTELVVVPAVGFAALVFFCSKWFVGISPAVVLATLAILPMLGGEAAVGLWFLGDRFEKFDLTAESR